MALSCSLKQFSVDYVKVGSMLTRPFPGAPRELNYALGSTIMKESWSLFISLLTASDANSQQIQDASHELRTGLANNPAQLLAPLFRDLCAQPSPSTPLQERAWGQLLQVLTPFLCGEPSWQPDYLEPLIEIYQLLGKSSDSRHQLLHTCAHVADPACLTAIADLLSTDPPGSSTAVGIVLAPLFQKNDLPYTYLFPRLLDGLEHPAVAAATLDLANHLVRENQVSRHPAVERRENLEDILRHLNRRMEHLAENPGEAEQSAQQTNAMVVESIALMISLCDSLALIGNPSSIAPLRQTLDLPHRRLQVESAAALARLGDEHGIHSLLRLAEEPVVRLHVLAYAQELELADQVDPDYLTDNARAAGHLALWLSQDQQMGIPPTDLDCIDQRTLFWPGYNEPVDCFLLRYRFQLGEAIYSNLGIVGPVTHSFTANLENLPIDDVYAIFAGWHAEHEDIFEQDVTQLNTMQEAAVQRYREILVNLGYSDVTPQLWATFLGDQILITSAVQNGSLGIAITDGHDTFWHPSSKNDRPLSTDDVYNLFKGRKLLQTFNA